MWPTVIVACEVCALLMSFLIWFYEVFKQKKKEIQKSTQTQPSLEMIGFLAIKAILSGPPHHPCLCWVLPAVNDWVWSVTFLHKWNTSKQRVVPVKSDVIPNTHRASTDTQVLPEPFSLTDLRDCLAPNVVFVSEMAAISDWSRVEGLFWTCEGGKQSEGGAHGERLDLSEPRGPGVGGRGRKSQKVRDN